jgi:ATP-dependent metalloprotease
LANLEQVANNNPGSATAQNAFYQALLRQNMPHIIVERHSTGQYASNPAVEAAYARALEQSGGQELGRIGSTNFGPSSNGQGGQLSSEQLQAIGQAVAAKSRGSGVATARSGTGGKNEPLYVVVEESWRTTLFAIFRTALFYLFALYIFTVIITFGMEMFTPLRKLGGASGANEAKPELQKTRFSDVHGCDEAKEDLQELVDFLKNPDSFSTLGGKLPKGVLLVGPPGTGKTLLARAVAGEAGVPFFYMSGSEFDEMYVGVGAKRVRELFAAARAKSPSIIFIDELDAVGGKRNERDPGYAKQTLNQLLTELDGFDQTTGIVLIGATNLPQALDKALVRPGRFDRNVSVPLPDVRGRIAILKHHLEKVKTDASVDPAIIARGCPGFSGAELENVVNQAAVHASKNKSTKITEADLSWAKDKVLMGAERRSAVIQAKDKLMTAYHEGGHALVGMLTAGNDPLYKATIMPRGQALGVTHFLPELDRVSMSKKELEARIDMAMGGKMAEELIYGSDNVTTGASSDITNATNTAYHMVTQAGMSATLGNVDLASDYERLSSETKQKIEDEVRRLVEEGRARALKLLTDNRAALERLAIALVEYETLDREEMEKIVRGEQLVGKIKADPNAMIKLPDSAPPPPDISAPPGPISLPGITTGSSKNVES